MKKRLTVLVLLLALLSAAVPVLPLSAQENIAAQTPGNGCPYYIMVNREANTVTVYGLDAAGYYTVPLKAMICSTGRAGHETPPGTFSVLPLKKEWCLMYDGTYAQYTTAFNGDILFHSICYSATHPGWLIAAEYNMLGSPASLGCVRLQTVDAKWIYDNCAPGTLVTVYDSPDPGPLGKPARLVDRVAQTWNYDCWDPTDPRPENPWRDRLAESFALSSAALELEAGEAALLSWTILPDAAAALLTPSWSSDNRSIAAVDAGGRIVAMGEGSAVITGSAGGKTASCTVTVTGNLLPLDDAVPGAWYYNDLRYVYETGMMTGTWPRQFSPDSPVSVAAAIQTLYNLSLSEGGKAVKAEADAESEEALPWYADAMAWAEQEALTEGIDTVAFTPEREIARAELVALLYRYEQAIRGSAPEGRSALDGFTDAQEIYPSVVEAVEWAVSAGILKGTDTGALDPRAQLNRAQMAALLRRWLEEK